MCILMKIQGCVFQIHICLSKNTGLAFLKIHPCIFKVHPCIFKTHPCIFKTHPCILKKYSKQIQIFWVLISLQIYEERENTPLYFEVHPCIFKIHPCIMKIHPCIFKIHPCIFRKYTSVLFRIHPCIFKEFQNTPLYFTHFSKYRGVF